MKTKTRMIIAVTNELAAAPQSDAKDDMIEELSENLYQRYTDLVEEGVSEEEAFKRAMDDLGDVNELLAYLADTTGQNEAEEAGAESAEEAAKGGEEKHQAWTMEEIGNLGMEFGREIGKLVGDAVNSAKEWDIIRFNTEKKEEGEIRIPAGEIHSLEAKLKNGDVELSVVEGLEDIVITGEVEKLETRVTQDGALYIRQGNTASSSFLFVKGWGSTDIRIALPLRVWKNLGIETVSGDIRCEDFLEAEEMRVRSTSGDITLKGYIRDAELTSVSGDIFYNGDMGKMSVNSCSGDVRLYTGILPASLDVDTKSGDCSLRLPETEGFTLRYRTVSGDIRSNMELVSKVGEQSGKAVYRDGGDREFSVSSISGDISIEKC